MSNQNNHQLKLETIERWLKDSNCDVRAAAMNACQGRDVPMETIERGLQDADCDVRAAAMNACQERKTPFPPSRTFEPPEKVYKKCCGGVIVVAEIPADAHVRGDAGKKCRASKAKIIDIIGNLCGEKVGVSLYNKKTLYYIGDEIEIENFDFSHQECSIGYHFFCTKEEAENY